MTPKGWTKAKQTQADTELEIRMNIWRMFYELKKLHDALDTMQVKAPELADGVRARVEKIEECAMKVYR